MIGTFGPVTFTSSNAAVRTFTGMKKTKGHRFAKHSVVLGKPKLERIAPDADSVSFDMRFDLALGVNPATEIATLEELVEAGEAYDLVVGGIPLGTFVIEKMDEELRRIDGKGTLLVASVSLQLLEYV